MNVPAEEIARLIFFDKLAHRPAPGVQSYMHLIERGVQRGEKRKNEKREKRVSLNLPLFRSPKRRQSALPLFSIQPTFANLADFTAFRVVLTFGNRPTVGRARSPRPRLSNRRKAGFRGVAR
jgi:hypothetical protein